mgnify:CR=1 FL=1
MRKTVIGELFINFIRYQKKIMFQYNFRNLLQRVHHVRRLIALAALRLRRQVRTIRLDEQPVLRHDLRQDGSGCRPEERLGGTVRPGGGNE